MFGVPHVALGLVLSLYLVARVEGPLGLEVFGEVARVVVDIQVLHEYAAGTLVLLPLVRQRIARSQRVEQLVAQNVHGAVTEPVKTVAKIERVVLLFAQIRANVVCLVQYLLGSQRRHGALDDSVVVTRRAEVIPLAVRTGYVAIELCCSATDAVG